MSYASTEFMLVVLTFGGHFGKEKNVLLQYCRLTCTGFWGCQNYKSSFIISFVFKNVCFDGGVLHVIVGNVKLCFLLLAFCSSLFATMQGVLLWHVDRKSVV